MLIDYSDEEQRSALAIIQSKFRLTASQYPEEYLRLIGKSGNQGMLRPDGYRHPSRRWDAALEAL